MRALLFGLLVLAGCENSSKDAPATGGSAGSGGGVAGSGGVGGGGGLGGSGGGVGGLGCEPAPKVLAPGEALTKATDQGGGACLGISVAAFLAKIHAAHPDLADVKQIYTPDVMSDGSFVYPYRRPDGSFAFVLKRGGGDCPAGCTENEYWYFEAGPGCAAQDAGHFKPTWTQSCLTVEGEARWGRPPTPDPVTICGADLTPQDVSGKHPLWACASRMPCSLEKPTGDTLAAMVTLTLAQDGADPKKGTATLSGTGYPAVDGVALPATFLRKRFSVAFHQDNLPATCLKSLDVVLAYDFEGFALPQLSVDEVDTLDCQNAPGNYCKGGLSGKLFPAAP